MKIKNWFSFGKDSNSEPENIERKSIYGGQQQILLQEGDFAYYALAMGDGLAGYGKMDAQTAMSLYRKSSSVATAVDIIAQEMSRIDPVIKNPDGSLDDSHPILDKLNNPNDWNETWSFFFGSLARASLLTGDDYTYALGITARPPLELYAVKPQNVNTVTGSMDQRPNSYTIYNGDGIGSYNRTRGKTGFRFYDGNLKELWHNSRYSSQCENISGDSPLEAICLDIHSQIKGRIHNTKLLEHGGRPSLLVTFKDTMTQDQHDERRQSLNEQVAGANNAGKIITVSSSDMDIQELGTNNKDMDYANLERISSLAVYNRYRIPLPLVTNDASTYNNLTTAVESLYDFAVLPNTDMLLSSLSMFLMPRYGLSPEEYQITYNPDEIEALKKRRVENLKQRKEIGIETTNELREGMPNREPVDGGDVILVSSTMIPISEASTAEEIETETPEEEAQRLADEQ